MGAPEAILTKVKLLLNLAESANANESANAKELANRLITKYNISEEELKQLDKQPTSYGKDDLLIHTFSIIGWVQQLALACGKHFYCYIVQEIVAPASGETEYNYYVYGDDEDVSYVKFSFHAFHKKILDLVTTQCAGRGPIYISSYCEGVVEAIRSNIAMYGIDIPDIKQAIRPVAQENLLNNGAELALPAKAEKQRPEKESVGINKDSLVRDIRAYFKGLEDGKGLHLQDILELEAENETPPELE